jgi:glucose/arabinose dehydrogenase
MNPRSCFPAIAALVLALVSTGLPQARAAAAPLPAVPPGVPAGVWVRDGYALTIAIEGIKVPRFLATGPDGTLYVSVPKEGKIVACRDKDGDGVYDTTTAFVSGKPPATILQGMQWHDGWLWFAQLNSVAKARDTNGDGVADEEVAVLGAEQLPTGAKGGHMWRALLIHGGRIYTHVGDQTNATDEPIEASERKKIWSFALDGSDKKLFASGLRNTEKLVVRPGTDEIWGVDHDIDLMAAKLEGDRTFGQPITDHNPPAELNHYVAGGFYGHPWLVGKNQPNLMFLTEPKLMEYASKATIPEWLMPAHCSANSLTFYRGDKIPQAHGDAFVAMKGGWNATAKVGYCLSRILFENGHPYGELKMVNFLKNGTEILGRPADCTQAPDGSLLFSDDLGGKVYRLKYVGK